MNSMHRNPGSREPRDVWIRALPLPLLNSTILDSLSKTSLTTNLQQISVAKLVLNELATIQAFNQECMRKDFKDLCDEREFKMYLEMFQDLFHRIVENEEWKSDAKTSLIQLVQKHCDEGTVNFEGTDVKASLIKTTTAVQIKDLVINALTSEDEDEFNLLLKTCSPSVPKIFQQAMLELFSIFKGSKLHPNIIKFSRKFIFGLKQIHNEDLLNMYPTCLVPLFVLHECSSSVLKSSDSSKSTMELPPPVEAAILTSFNEVYNPKSIECLRSSEIGFDQGLISFYIASSCEEFLPVIERNLKDGKILFRKYPHLWLYLRSK